MISIKRFLNTQDEVSGTEGPLRQALALLLAAIDIHAVQGDELDYVQFRSAIQEIAAQFSSETSAAQIFVTAGAVSTALREYNERTSRYLRSYDTEYQNMVAMLAQTVACVTNASDSSALRLRDIQQQLKAASVIEDVRTLRMRLSQCLESIQNEIENQKMEAERVRIELQKTLPAPSASTGPPKPVIVIDPVTGLPNHAAAEAALAEAADASGVFAVPIVPNRVHAINALFGYRVGDRVMRRVSDHYRGALLPEDRMFRWRGPSLIALIARDSSIENVRMDLARIGGGRIGELTDVGNRSILLPVSASWAVFPMNTQSESLVVEIDRFVASRVPQHAE